jgi:acylphosphatase
MKTYRYVIHGLVQGVNFRYYTVLEAEKLGIAGSVKNLPNGEVEVFAQGDKAFISQFESFLHRGPRLARVERLDKEVVDMTEFRGFDIGW